MRFASHLLPFCVAALAGWHSLGLGASSQAKPNELVFVAATNHSAPLSVYVNGQLSGGILKDLGDGLARRLGLQARYVSQSSKRAPMALRDGEGDLLCYARPQWIGDELAFTVAVIPNAEVLAARGDAPTAKALADLRGQSVGTVLGYVYPELDRVLGTDFRRDNAVDMATNLRKLGAGRMAYAMTDRLVLRDLQRRQPELGLREELEVNRFEAGCALSPKSSHKMSTINAALKSMVAAGEVQQIIDRYAPSKP